MIYRNPLAKKIIIRLLILLATFFLWTLILSGGSYFIVNLGMLILIGVQVHAFVKEQTANQKAISEFLESLQSNSLDTDEDISSEKDPALKAEFVRIKNAIRTSQKEKEAEYQYFRNIVQHVGIGIITFNQDGDIQLYNFAAKKLLNTTYQIKKIQDLELVSPELVETFETLKTGGRKLVQVNIGEEVRQLSVYAIELQLHDKNFKLISIQNIQSELDEKEMEAWRNLIRVLTHEIMNSVTPISSLSGTTRGMLASQLSEEKSHYTIEHEDMMDLQSSLKTIENRSEGLIRFLNEFRSLTHTPTPKMKEENINLILESICLLMAHDLQNLKIHLVKEFEENLPTILIDRELIEQVIINLLKNSSESFGDETEEKNIWISSNLDAKKRVTVTVKDNGSGIEPEALTKIFIPFFTTKKSGSGIGLSLSKEIMRKHQGNISVQSTLGSGTEFTLKF
ncbi:ATP-binding protein [Marivirga sp. S37H4]|uniref:histidine kinase n=1 Tax=Marivirga aurantiaca TaxID=2802615 RepID=A0A934X0H3_9BACT|nr:ATP-binding protein [Marivirga aurantiaca]MBK6266663.1 ATP-binding protein [Marivirga aurantiaca]